MPRPRVRSVGIAEPPAYWQPPAVAMLELVIPYPLQTANVTRGYHWRAWHRETRTLQALLHQAMYRVPNIKSWSIVMATEMRLDGRGHYAPVEERLKERRRVTVVRVVKSSRQFIRDDDNLRFSVKPLNDALKRIGLIYDDTRDWLEQPMPLQELSPAECTIVRIERLHA